MKHESRIATAVIAAPFALGAVIAVAGFFRIYVRFGLPRLLFVVGITALALAYVVALYWAVGIKGRDAARKELE